MTNNVVNFGRNVDFQPAAIYRPHSVDEVLTILDRHRGEEIRAVGRLHSWSPAPTTTGVMLDLQHLNAVEIDHADPFPTVTVGGGCQIKSLIKQIAAEGLTLPSLGLIDEQSVAGATATGTHGSGKHSLSHYVESVSIVHYDSLTGQSVMSIVDGGQDLLAARCSLGLMGVIVSMTFRCRPRYNIEEHARVHESLDSVLAMEADYPQQQFYLMPWSWRYFGHHRAETESRRSRLAALYRLYCFVMIDIGLHVLILILVKLIRLARPVRMLYQHILPFVIIRNWKVVEDSNVLLVMEHELFRHVETEVFVQRTDLQPATLLLTDIMLTFAGREMLHEEHTESCLTQIGKLSELRRNQGTYTHHYPICFRRVLMDETLVSMACSGTRGDEDWYAISMISYQWPTDRDGFFAFAEFVAHSFASLFHTRCHWGKHNPLDPSTIENSYPAMVEFDSIVRRFDSKGAFKNDWFRELFQLESVSEKGVRLQ